MRGDLIVLDEVRERGGLEAGKVGGSARVGRDRGRQRVTRGGEMQPKGPTDCRPARKRNNGRCCVADVRRSSGGTVMSSQAMGMGREVEVRDAARE